MISESIAALTRWGILRPAGPTKADTPGEPLVSVLLVTYNRLPMLRRCLTSLLSRDAGVDYEIVVWDNASTDGSHEYLCEIEAAHAQVRVVRSEKNIGVNGVAAAVRRARGLYLVEMDDDVLDVPENWLAEMVESFRRVFRAGYLCANVVQDEITNGAKPSPEHYRSTDYGDGVVIEHGPAGGWCTITSRNVIEKIGNFVEIPGRIFFAEDGEFASRCLRNHYRIGVIQNVVVYHAAGVEANAKYGCLEVCELKYSDSDEFRPLLDIARRAAAEQREDGPAPH